MSDAPSLPQETEAPAYGYAERLARAIWQKHWSEVSPDWKPLPTLLGVLTQIDNMTCGLGSPQVTEAPSPAHSKSEYKRRVALGDPNVLPPSLTANIVFTGKMKPRVYPLDDDEAPSLGAGTEATAQPAKEQQ